MKMSKKRIPTQVEAARNLLIILDGKQWRTKSVAIAHRRSNQDHYLQ